MCGYGGVRRCYALSMNEASTSRKSAHDFFASLQHDVISRAAITLYTVTFFAAPLFGITGWRPFVPMALFALIAVVIGPRAYRVAGSIALLIAFEGGRLELRDEQRYEHRVQTLSAPTAK